MLAAAPAGPNSQRIFPIPDVMPMHCPVYFVTCVGVALGLAEAASSQAVEAELVHFSGVHSSVTERSPTSSDTASIAVGVALVVYLIAELEMVLLMLAFAGTVGLVVMIDDGRMRGSSLIWVAVHRGCRASEGTLVRIEDGWSVLTHWSGICERPIRVQLGFAIWVDDLTFRAIKASVLKKCN